MIDVEKLRRMMTERGKMPRAFAKDCGVHYFTVLRTLNGSHAPDLSTIDKYAKGLGVSIADLLLPAETAKAAA